jgi:hypothetical protein
MNWGYKILMVIILFISAMMGMVYIASQQKNEMIDEHYYEKELAYQGLIDAKNNLASVSKEPLLSQTAQAIEIRLPTSLFENITENTIEFLRPDDQTKDLKMVLLTDSTGKQTIQKTNFHRGMYKVRIKWSKDNKLYYKEDNLFVEL